MSFFLSLKRGRNNERTSFPSKQFSSPHPVNSDLSQQLLTVRARVATERRASRRRRAGADTTEEEEEAKATGDVFVFIVVVVVAIDLSKVDAALEEEEATAAALRAATREPRVHLAAAEVAMAGIVGAVSDWRERERGSEKKEGGKEGGGGF